LDYFEAMGRKDFKDTARADRKKNVPQAELKLSPTIEKKRNLRKRFTGNDD